MKAGEINRNELRRRLQSLVGDSGPRGADVVEHSNEFYRGEHHSQSQYRDQPPLQGDSLYSEMIEKRRFEQHEQSLDARTERIADLVCADRQDDDRNNYLVFLVVPEKENQQDAIESKA